MVDISMISGGLASLKAAKDIAEGLVNLRDTAKFQGAVVDLQAKILAAHADQFALLERVRELESKMAQPEAAEGEPMHRIVLPAISKDVNPSYNLITKIL